MKTGFPHFTIKLLFLMFHPILKSILHLLFLILLILILILLLLPSVLLNYHRHFLLALLLRLAFVASRLWFLNIFLTMFLAFRLIFLTPYEQMASHRCYGNSFILSLFLNQTLILMLRSQLRYLSFFISSLNILLKIG